MRVPPLAELPPNDLGIQGDILVVGRHGVGGVHKRWVARVSVSTGAEVWRRAILCVPLVGLLFLVAGVSHFTEARAFEAIYPPVGTWGLWYLPGSASFHVAWTGLAELVLGAGVLAGGASFWLDLDLDGPLRWLTPAAASGLVLLVLAVTPANIYMYTHGATMTGLGPPGDLALGFPAGASRLPAGHPKDKLGEEYGGCLLSGNAWAPPAAAHVLSHLSEHVLKNKTLVTDLDVPEFKRMLRVGMKIPPKVRKGVEYSHICPTLMNTR